MSASLPLMGEARLRKKVSAEFASPSTPETVRNEVSEPFALECLNRSIDAYCAAMQMKEETLAANVGMSRGNFSRLLSGRYDQKLPLDLLDKLPREIVTDFLARMQEQHEDPTLVAADQLVRAGIRFIRLAHRRRQLKMSSTG